MAYFSRAGQNYWNGGRRVLQVGNTAVIAGMISDLADVDVYRIEAADPYPFGYEPTVQRNWREVQADARPVIARPLPSLRDYGTILLGSPVWAGQEPMIMRTFIDGTDLAGKVIHPFVSYAVSQMGSVSSDYTRLCPGAAISNGLAIRGEETRQGQPDVRAWLSRIGLR